MGRALRTEDYVPAKKILFSYRFDPDDEGDLYGPREWNDFWGECKARARVCSDVLVTDIADFYNQVSHHTLENQLTASGFPNQAMRYLIRVMGSISAKGSSRGVPVGPHLTHILA